MELHLSVFWFFFLGVCAVNCTEYEGCNHTCLVTNDMSQRCMYQKIGQKCYYQFSKNVTWIVNRQWCIDQGLEMVRLSRESIPDMAQLHFNYPVEATPIKWDYMWLAGKGVSLADWTFLYDTLVLHTSMIVDVSVSDASFKYCGYLDTKDFSLKVDECYHKMKFLCRNGNDITAFKTNATWFQAREKCLLLGSDLFYLRDETKEMPYEHFTGLIKSAMNNSQIPVGEALHIGVQRLSWQWSNGDPIAAFNWHYYRTPNPATYDYTCLAFNELGSWDSRYCPSEYRAFCQNIPLEDFETADTTPGMKNTPRESGTRNNVQTQPNFLKELIVAGTLAGVFFLGCVILVAILIFKSRKIGPERGEYDNQARRQDADNYDYLNPAAPHYLNPETPHYLHAPATSRPDSQGQQRPDDQKPRNGDCSYSEYGN